MSAREDKDYWESVYEMTEICVVCGHPLSEHLEQEHEHGTFWRCHCFGPDLWQCECSLKKDDIAETKAYYDVSIRLQRRQDELKKKMHQYGGERDE